MLRTPQRVYNQKALEKWFERLSVNWENFFRADELSLGRHLYRKNEIIATELTEDCAIISFRDSGEGLYAVIEWEENSPRVRVSSQRIRPSLGLAAAGLYELEELIADLIPPLPGAVNDAACKQLIQPLPDLSKTVAVQPLPRQMEVHFQPALTGLLMRAYWMNPAHANGSGNAPRRVAAFPGDSVSDGEREQIIRLTALLHRSQFQARPKAHGFLLENSRSLVSFLQQDLETWRRHFKITIDESLRPWMAGVRQVTVNLRLDGQADRLSAFWQVQSPGIRPSAGVLDGILKQPEQTHFIPGEGIFVLNPRLVNTVREWKPLIDQFTLNSMPPYLMFRFLDHPGFAVELGASLEAWRKKLTHPQPKALALPDWLRAYQKTGVEWLNQVLEAGGHPLLADEMGLGKTVQTLSLLSVRRTLELGPVLVVCPASVVPVWVEEIQRYYPEIPHSVVGKDNLFGKDLEPRLWISSYTQLRRHRQHLTEVTFAMAILDEAHFIKNPDSKTSQACLHIQAQHRMALSGTPMENRPLDLWTIFRFLMPGLLDGRSAHEKAVRSEPDALLVQMRRQLNPFLLRRTKDRVAQDLPPKTDVVLHCPLTPRQETLYRQIAADGLNQLRQNSGQVSRMHVFALMTRLRQVCCDPALLPGMHSSHEHSSKLRMLVEKLGEALPSGARVVIFSQFVRFLRRIERALNEKFPETPLFTLTGSTRDRAKPVSEFRKQPGAAVFLISLKAGGTGLNLQSADYVFLMDPWWNPAVEAQAIDRVHRLGTLKRVFVYRLITLGTLEERIEKLKDQKTEVFRQLLINTDEATAKDHIADIEEWLKFQ